MKGRQVVLGHLFGLEAAALMQDGHLIDLLVASDPLTALAPGASTTFTIGFDAAAAGTFGGTISLATNDADEDPFDFALSATAFVPTPEVAVLDGDADLIDGAGSIAFGVTPVAALKTRWK